MRERSIFYRVERVFGPDPRPVLRVAADELGPGALSDELRRAEGRLELTRATVVALVMWSQDVDGAPCPVCKYDDPEHRSDCVIYQLLADENGVK